MQFVFREVGSDMLCMTFKNFTL